MGYIPGSTNIAMENGPVEDVFPIENGDFPIAMLVYWRVFKKKQHFHISHCRNFPLEMLCFFCCGNLFGVCFRRMRFVIPTWTIWGKCTCRGTFFLKIKIP